MCSLVARTYTFHNTLYHTTQEYQNEVTSKREIEKEAELKMMPEISWKTASSLDKKKTTYFILICNGNLFWGSK